MSSYFQDWAQFITLADVALLMGLSWLAGLPLRQGGPATCAAWGFMLLAGAAALAFHAFRALNGPVALFLPAVAVLTALLLVVFRVLLPPQPVRSGQGGVLVAVLALAAVLLPLRLAQVDPSSSLSALLGWLPLYLKSCFAAGQFLGIEDMAAGRGVLSSYYYMTDFAGLAASTALLTGGAAIYPAYLATSVAAVLLSFAVLADGLGRSRAALAAFVLLALLGLALDPFFRTVMARHYGDGFLFLGGALVLRELVRDGEASDAALAAAAAAVFLVFGRHYGAFYAALIMMAGFLATKGWRRLGPWLALGVLLVLFSSREVAWVLNPPSPYYPGSKLVELMRRETGFWIKGAFFDWGLYWTDHPREMMSRAVWLVALLAAIPMIRAQKGRRAVLLAPLALFTLPSILMAVTGYRSGVNFNKLAIISLWLLPWYPAWLLSRSDLACRIDRGWLDCAALDRRLAAALTILLAAGFLVAPLGRSIYQDKVVDRKVWLALRAELGDEGTRDLAGRPLLYIYYEPGSGLRNYIGGDLMGDLDFWGATVWNRIEGAADLTQLMSELGWPNVYFGAGANYGGVVDSRWRKFEADLENMDAFPWVDRVVREDQARLVIVKRP